MSFLFKKTKSPVELVKSVKGAIVAYLEEKDTDEEATAKLHEKIGMDLKMMRFMFYGDPEQDPKPENIEKLTQEILSNDLLLDLVQYLIYFPFESRKDAATIFQFIIRRGQENNCLDYMISRPEILQRLVSGYDDETALPCGLILRECIRFEDLCKTVLESDYFYKFFTFVERDSFEVAADAFATLKLLLTKHKNLASNFLQQHYDEFFTQYNELIQSNNYVTKRQSLKLLGEILLDRKNFNVMIRYINDAENLKLMMILLRGKSKTIQFEAFHVFKVFVANPDKSKPILDILIRNKAKLIEFLQDFRNDIDEDEQFMEEKNILLATLAKLESPEEKASQ